MYNQIANSYEVRVSLSLSGAYLIGQVVYVIGVHFTGLRLISVHLSSHATQDGITLVRTGARVDRVKPEASREQTFALLGTHFHALRW
jgi:hypothetical protein